MPFDPYENFSVSTVATAPSPATTGTSLTLTAGDGARFPDPATLGEYNVTIAPPDELPTPDNAELVRVTGRTGDVLTIVREQEGTSARTVVVGDLIFLGDTKKRRDDLADMLPFVISDSDYISDLSGSQYLMPGWHFATSTTWTIPVGQMMYMPIYCRRKLPVDRIAFHQAVGAETGGALARLGLYSAKFLGPNRNFILPDALIVDGGTILVDTGGGKQVTVDVVLEGWNYIAMVADAELPAVTVPLKDAVTPPVQGGTNSVNGTTIDHIIPFVSGKSSYVAGGLPDPADSVFSSTTTVLNAFGRVRMKTA